MQAVFCLGMIFDEKHLIYDSKFDIQMFLVFQYEKHEEKVDPAHAHRHHVEAQVAETAALGLGGYALYEHHEGNKIHKQESHLGGGHQHGRQHGNHRH